MRKGHPSEGGTDTDVKDVSTSEVEIGDVKDVSTSEVRVVTLTLDEYLLATKVNVGLVASFTYEGKHNHPDMLEPKTLDDWNTAFEAQSNRVYK